MTIDGLIISDDFVNFSLTALFSLVIGLSQRRLHTSSDENKYLFGTDRTFTLIGIMGFVLYKLGNSSLYPFLIGLLILSCFLGVFYFFKLNTLKSSGMTSVIIALITYNIAPLIYTSPLWLSILIIVTVLILTEVKEPLAELTQKFQKDEFITLGKFLIIAGVILPALPNVSIIPYITITPYKVWLAVVAISGISYLSYLIKKFLFKDSGIVISGILGGLYSSTATTFVIARKSKLQEDLAHKYAAAIIFATSMMYLRILVLVFIFNSDLAKILFIPLFGLAIISIITGYLIKKKPNLTSNENTFGVTTDKNPLEIKAALIFTILFITFTILTHYTIQNYGQSGLNILASIVGVTDIDPFLINLFQGKHELSQYIIAVAALQATLSNNILKAFYAGALSNKHVKQYTTKGFIAIIIANIIAIGGILIYYY